MIQRKSWGCGCNNFANTSKGSKGHNIRSHEELFEDTESVTLRSSQSSQRTSRKFKGVVPQISQQNPKIKNCLRNIRGSLLSNGVNVYDIYGRSTRFLKILYCKKLYRFGLKGIKYEMKESYWTPKILLARNKLIKLFSCKHSPYFMKKVSLIQRRKPGRS